MEEDQWSVGKHGDDETLDVASRFAQLCRGVLCVNERVFLSPQYALESLLGPTGHLERFSAWAHIAGAVGFGVYAIVRHSLDEAQTESETIASWWVTGAVWSLAATFAASSIYHCTTPSKRFATVTRQLDYLAIYLSIVFGGVSDLAVVTRGFDAVPWLTIVDVPIAAVLVGGFFLFRRLVLDEDETWESSTLGCSMNSIFFYRLHSDGFHSALRKSSSLLLSLSSVGLNTPALFSNAKEVAGSVIALQMSGFAVLVIGMILDNLVVWPDLYLKRGKQYGFPISCKPCGCVMNAHAIWHILAIVGAGLQVVAREVALDSFE